MSKKIRVLYDGYCPFCANYQKLWRLKSKHTVEVIDARTAPDLVAQYANDGYDIDETFIVDVEGKVLTHGGAVAFINGTLAPWWTGLPLLSNEKFLAAIYPGLRAGRNATLRLLGHKKITPRASAGQTAEAPVEPSKIADT